MTIEPDCLLPLARAHVALLLRIDELLQQRRRRWLEEWVGSFHDRCDLCHGDMREMLAGKDWNQLAALPAESFWKLAQQLLAEQQGLTHTALVDQASFMAGYQQAVADWQQATAQALGQVRNAMPWYTTLHEAMKAWGIAADGLDSKPRRG